MTLNFFLNYAAVVNISVTSVEFEISAVAVILDWTIEPMSSFYSYNVTVVPQLHAVINGSTHRVMLMVPYNFLYNVTVVADHLCGQSSIPTSTELYYNKCI